MTAWKYATLDRVVAFRSLDSGALESCMASALAAGTPILDPDPPPASDVAEAARRLGVHDDPLRIDLLTRLRTATNVQISAYVDANVTDVPTARALFKRILLLIALDARNGS